MTELVRVHRDTGIIRVPLTRGLFAIVDEADAHLVLPYKWCAMPVPGGRNWYAVREISDRLVPMHRALYSPSPGKTVDHIDGDGLNNCRENMRAATQQEQTRNRRALVGKRSLYKGVIWRARPSYRAGGFWFAKITVSGHSIYRAAKTEIAAARLYNALACEHFGEFARLNEIPA